MGEQNNIIELDAQVRGAITALWDASGRAGTLRDFTLDVRNTDGRIRVVQVEIDGVGLEERIVLTLDGKRTEISDITQQGPWKWTMRAGELELVCDGDQVSLSRS